MAKLLLVLLRVLQVAAALANLVLASLVIHWYLSRSDLAPPSSFNFLIFAPVFSLVSVAYLELAPRLAPRASHPFASLAVEATNTVFYFAGFTALAVFLSKLLFCTGTICAVGRSTSVVAAAEFTLWIATTILLAKDIFKGGLRGPSDTGVHSVQPLGVRMRQEQRQQQQQQQQRRRQQRQQGQEMSQA